MDTASGESSTVSESAAEAVMDAMDRYSGSSGASVVSSDESVMVSSGGSWEW